MIRNCCSGLGHTQSHLEVPPKDIDSSNKGQMHGNPLSFTALDDSSPHGAPGVPPTLQCFVSHPPRVFPRTLSDEIFDGDNADPGLGSLYRSGSAISMPLGSNVALQGPYLASSQNVQEIKGKCPTTRISDMSSSLCLGLGHKLVNDAGSGLNFEGQVDTDRGCLSLKPVIKRPPEVQGGGEGTSPHNPSAKACVDDERGHPKRIRTEGLQAVGNKGICEGCVVGDLGLGSLNGKNESISPMQSPCLHSVGERCTARSTKAESSTPSGPLNPMLPWPRFVPCTWDQPFAEHEVEHTPIPPTQKFQVHLTTRSVEPEGGEQQRHLSEATVKHAWQQGGLKGGMPCPTWLECHDLRSLQGWWIHVLDGITRPLSLELHGGRTIRQERELLGLMDVDAVKCGVVVLSVQGVLQARWDYKFPLAANDGVMIVVAPRHTPMYELVEKAISQVRRLANQPCQDDLCILGDGSSLHAHESQAEEGALMSARQRAMHRQKARCKGVGQDIPCHGQQVESRKNKQKQRQEVVFFAFLQGWRCVYQHQGRTIAEVLEDEWGVPHDSCVLTLNGKSVSAYTKLSYIPQGIPVRVTSRLRGGGQAHMKKLRELLLAKGVSQDDVQGRAAEVVAAIGEGSLAEVFKCFDSWQSLKSKCQGKLRIIKQSELKPPRPKKHDEAEDPLQTQDPWAEALQHRQIKPEAAFFRTQDGRHPVILSAVSHGCSGIAVVDTAEAQLLAKGDDDLSPDELSVLVLGEPSLPESKRPHRQIEFPCQDAKGCRMLVRGTLIDLGAAPMQVVGEDSKFRMTVIDSGCVACEVHCAEYEEWPELITGPIRHLKKAFALNNDELLHTWGKKIFRQGKQVQSIEVADALFVMLRVKAACVERLLRQTQSGLYASPRLESGEPDWSYKVVWCPEKSTAELRIIASSTPGCLGVVKSKSGVGVRVKCQDYGAVRRRLYPGWTPQENTPYDTSLPQRFELHHVHPGASKSDLQDLLNAMSWKALVIKQIRPKQWLIAAKDAPEKDTILTEHGCILVLPSMTSADKGAPKGKGKGKKGKGPSWLLGSHLPHVVSERTAESSIAAAPHVTAPVDAHGPVKKAVLEVEQKLEERFAALREEAAVTHGLLKQDIQNMRGEFRDHVAQQKLENQALTERVTGVEASLATQLSGFMTTLNATLSQQSQELSGRILEGQQSLRSELTQEFRQQFGNVRKRTPPPRKALRTRTRDCVSEARSLN